MGVEESYSLNINTYSLKQFVYRQPFLAYARRCPNSFAGVFIALLLAYVSKRENQFKVLNMCFTVIPKQAFGFAGLVLQALGAIIVLGSNFIFWYRARKAYGSVKKYAFDTACAV